MPDTFQEILFPEKGLDVTQPYSLQPEGTTPEAVNVRLCDSILERDRGGQRCGLSRYVNAKVASAKIQDLNTVVYCDDTALIGGDFQDGDQNWNSIGHAGSYVVCFWNQFVSFNAPWTFSQVISVDPTGNVTLGPDLTSTPATADVPLSATIALPSNYFVVAYWRPGHFPTTFTQEGSVFPGFGWMATNFPTGARDNTTLSYPIAGTRGFTATGDGLSVGHNGNYQGPPAHLFWNWNAGTPIRNVDETFKRAYVMTHTLTNTTGAPLTSRVYLNGNLIQTNTTSAAGAVNYITRTDPRFTKAGFTGVTQPTLLRSFFNHNRWDGSVSGASGSGVRKNTVQIVASPVLAGFGNVNVTMYRTSLFFTSIWSASTILDLTTSAVVGNTSTNTGTFTLH